MRRDPSFSRVTSGLDFRNVVEGDTPTPRMTRSAGSEVPSFSSTEPTAFESDCEGLALSTEADIWNLTPDFWRLDWKILPTSAPMTRSRGVLSMPTTVILWLDERALATSMPIKELPITTIFFPLLSPMAERMACTSDIVRIKNTLDKSLNPGRGRTLGVPPVARISLVYG